jgi:hypothetical protein
MHRPGQTCCGSGSGANPHADPHANPHANPHADPRGRGSLPVVNKGCCGGRDYGPVRDDEGPSAADMARFNRETIDCPKCGEEMYDEAEVCLNCGHILVEEDKAGLPPWVVGTAVVLIGLLAMWLVL